MVTYSGYPVFVDGVRLDSAAWNIEARTRATAPARAADVVLPGVDGVSASLNDDLDPMVRTYSMWVLGTDEDGIIPSGSNAISQCLANVDQLSYLFGIRHRLIDVQEVVDHLGTVRQFWGKVIEPIVPEIRAGGVGRFTVSVMVPAGVGQDVNTADWSRSSLTSAVFYEVTTLAGMTGPLSDAIVLVTGPITNPRVTDLATGGYVQLNAAIPAGQQWRINCGTWASQYGAGLTFTSLDTAGTFGGAITSHSGASYLRMRPVLSGGVRRVQLSLTGTGITTATTLAVRARRKFLI